jgi:hypothetical protein
MKLLPIQVATETQVVKPLQNNTGNNHKYQSQNPIGGESLSEMTNTLQRDLTSPQTVDIGTIIGETQERV